MGHPSKGWYFPASLAQEDRDSGCLRRRPGDFGTMTPIGFGMTFEQGDIVLAEVPFSDASGTKRRPVMVVSSKAHNAKSLDVIVFAITSNLVNAEHSVPIDNTDLSDGTIVRPSLIKVDHVLTLDKSVLFRKLCRVKPDVVAKAKAILAAIIS